MFRRKKCLLFDERNELIYRNRASTSTDIPVLNDGPNLNIPQQFNQSFQGKMTQKVSKINKFFKSCLELIEDKYALQDLSALVEEPQLRM